MTVLILEERILIRPRDLDPIGPDHRVIGAFNPAAARYGDDLILLVRVAEQPPQQPDRLTSPRVEWHRGTPNWILDSFDPKGVDTTDPRVFEFPDGRVRLPHISHLRLVRLDRDATAVKEVITVPDLFPQEPWEELGIEDPRITQIGNTYYITYVAISRHMGITTALMTTRDFETFERHGIIFPTENKDVVLLPDLWDGKFVAYHRPTSHSWVSAPSITASLSPDALHWGGHRLLLGPRQEGWDSVKVGAGPPPVSLPQGWLLIYHGVDTATETSPIGRYCAGAALLDTDNPLRVLARTDQPLLRPDRPYEQTGFVSNVIFPTGALLSDDRESLLVFSGAADEVVGMLRIPVDGVLRLLGAR
jgi:predicted GH43/DUF377 family glycosyl hydrolase